MRVELLYSRSMYGTDKPNMQKEQDEEFCYPCLHTVSTIAGKYTLWYSNVKRDYFGTPKIVFVKGYQPGVPYLDLEGTYGLTQCVAAIKDSPEVLPIIAKAMDSDKFRGIMQKVQYTTHAWDLNIIRMFRKDFWKEFI